MNSSLRKAILAGGILNLSFALFHVFLCYQIHQNYATLPIYPLLMMFSIGGAIMVFFLAYTSLCCPADLVATRGGLSVLVLNVLVYLSRAAAEEIVLFPQPKPLVIGLCLLTGLLYLAVFIAAGKSSVEKPQLQSASAAS